MPGGIKGIAIDGHHNDKECDQGKEYGNRSFSK